jgi:hypothetical protein
MSEENLIGCTVRCVASNVKGIVHQKTELLGGTVQYSIQPSSADGSEVKDGYSIDVQQLDKIDDGISARRTDPVYPDIELGNEVKDLITGFRGVVTSRVTFLNGCVYFNVERKGPTTPENKDEERLRFFPSIRLSVVGAGIAPPKPVEATAPAARKPGGPTTRAQRAC